MRPKPMIYKAGHRYVLLIMCLLVGDLPAVSCSMYKVTVGDKTMVGCNEDAWRLTPRIWFEPSGKFGAAFTGSRYDGPNGFAPQSGMNEAGLTYSRLSALTPPRGSYSTEGRKAITNATFFLKNVLHQCSSVEEVKELFSTYDHSIFIQDVLIYIDRSGRYLIVEPYSTTTGHDPHYVLANFCPSATSDTDAMKFERYRKGAEVVRTGVDTTFSFCAALSDSMHVCRERMGDGTLLTSIWDLNAGRVRLYFYHDYNQFVEYTIAEELAKGDHIVDITSLFGVNGEFERLAGYHIPQSSPVIMGFVMIAGSVFLFSGVYFLLSYFRRRKELRSHIRLIWLPVGILMGLYMVVLARTMGVFFFPAPYKDPESVWVSVASYIPFVMLFAIVPIARVNLNVWRSGAWRKRTLVLFTLNTVLSMVSVGLFVYWGLLDVFGQRLQLF